MKQMFVLSLMILCLSAADTFAQMGHGMMREYGSGQGMMDHMMMNEGMMSREQTAERMADITRQMSELMRDLSGKIEGLPSEKLDDLRNIMKEMSDEMETVSRLVEKGTATDEEVKDIREKIAKTREEIFGMDK